MYHMMEPRRLQSSRTLQGFSLAGKRIEDLDDARRLQLLVENVIDYAIYLISLDGFVVSWNSGAPYTQMVLFMSMWCRPLP